MMGLNSWERPRLARWQSSETGPICRVTQGPSLCQPPADIGWWNMWLLPALSRRSSGGDRAVARPRSAALIGLWPTLAIVVLTAIAGTYLVRPRGFRWYVRCAGRSSGCRTRPSRWPTARWCFSPVLSLLNAGVLHGRGRVSPCFVPPVRSAVYRFIRKRIRVETVSYGQNPGPRTGPDDTTIEGSYEEVPPSRRSGPSGWTRD